MPPPPADAKHRCHLRFATCSTKTMMDGACVPVLPTRRSGTLVRVRRHKVVRPATVSGRVRDRGGTATAPVLSVPVGTITMKGGFPALRSRVRSGGDESCRQMRISSRPFATRTAQPLIRRTNESARLGTLSPARRARARGRIRSRVEAGVRQHRFGPRDRCVRALLLLGGASGEGVLATTPQPSHTAALGFGLTGLRKLLD